MRYYELQLMRAQLKGERTVFSVEYTSCANSAMIDGRSNRPALKQQYSLEDILGNRKG